MKSWLLTDFGSLEHSKHQRRRQQQQQQQQQPQQPPQPPQQQQQQQQQQQSWICLFGAKKHQTNPNNTTTTYNAHIIALSARVQTPIQDGHPSDGESLYWMYKPLTE